MCEFEFEKVSLMNYLVITVWLVLYCGGCGGGSRRDQQFAGSIEEIESAVQTELSQETHVRTEDLNESDKSNGSGSSMKISSRTRLGAESSSRGWDVTPSTSLGPPSTSSISELSSLTGVSGDDQFEPSNDANRPIVHSLPNSDVSEKQMAIPRRRLIVQRGKKPNKVELAITDSEPMAVDPPSQLEVVDDQSDGGHFPKRRRLNVSEEPNSQMSTSSVGTFSF